MVWFSIVRTLPDPLKTGQFEIQSSTSLDLNVSGFPMFPDFRSLPKTGTLENSAFKMSSFSMFPVFEKFDFQIPTVIISRLQDSYLGQWFPGKSLITPKKSN